MKAEEIDIPSPFIRMQGKSLINQPIGCNLYKTHQLKLFSCQAIENIQPSVYTHARCGK